MSAAFHGFVFGKAVGPSKRESYLTEVETLILRSFDLIDQAPARSSSQELDFTLSLALTTLRAIDQVRFHAVRNSLMARITKPEMDLRFNILIEAEEPQEKRRDRIRQLLALLKAEGSSTEGFALSTWN